jgi:hypothetical protein
MKTLLLYTPRSGTNSICKYFLNQYPNFTYFNQPWSNYKNEDIKFIPYEDCITHNNLLVKSEIQNFHKLGISKEKLYSDFDKVMIMNRKNKREQSISLIIATQSSNFLNSNKRKYFTKSLNDDMIESTITNLVKSETLFENYRTNETMSLSYEDIYYEKKIDNLFDFLNLRFVPEDFDKFIDIKNKYSDGEYNSKIKKTLL